MSFTVKYPISFLSFINFNAALKTKIYFLALLRIARAKIIKTTKIQKIPSQFFTSMKLIAMKQDDKIVKQKAKDNNKLLSTPFLSSSLKKHTLSFEILNLVVK